MNLFYNATTISISNGKIAPFWDSPWLEGDKPKDIAPLIFEISKKKKSTVAQALHCNSWIKSIKMDANLTVHHIHDYLRLWIRLQDVHLHVDRADSIVWSLTSNGQYSSASAYEAQFFGATLTNFNKMVWKAWATPKVKFFHGWPFIIEFGRQTVSRGKGGMWLCPLCKQAQESAAHLFSHCRYTKRLWNLAKGWLGIVNIQPQDW
jgi:hypothetical protein